jgi:tetratricopeptide (TPR) repeat protein
MRNFERQADLHVFKAIGSSEPLIAALEKIGWLSGNIRDLPSWHHFGIGERVGFLEQCARQPGLIRRHDAKVRLTLALFLLVIIATGFASWKLPLDSLADQSKTRFIEALIVKKVEAEPRDPRWHRMLGDLELERRHYEAAIVAYEKSLALDPDNAETLNNLAWLLLTAENAKFRDYERALTLARQAADLLPAAFVLDTLAYAYWVHGRREEAVRLEQEAMAKDPQRADFYRAQMEKFAGPYRLPAE